MTFKTLDDLGEVAGKAVLVREDLNVPMADGQVTDDTRLRAAVPTLTELADKGAKVLVLAHFGRPKGERSDANSLRQVVPALSHVLGRPVTFIDDCAGAEAEAAVAALADGTIAVLENTRFHKGEERTILTSLLPSPSWARPM
jgi:phosphoglycerate kinase